MKLVGFFILLVSPFVLLWLIDRSFSFMHWRFYPDSFPSEREVMMRNNLMPRGFLGDQKAFMEEIKSPKVKVAIFGGSSAVGFAAPVGFDRFLEEAAPDRLVVHNYAEAGSPFAGYQAELAKIVMPYYDVILLYAGHNENWSYLYKRRRENNEKIVLPWGSKVEYQAADFRHSLKKMELERLFNDDVFGGGVDSSYINRIRTTFWGDIYNISRLVYFIKSIGSKILGNTSLASSSPEHAVRLPFFQKDAFMDNDVKQTSVDNYAKAVSEIQNKLRPGKRLVISTILANDLFPPLLDSVDKEASVAEADSKAASLYGAIAKGNFDLSPDDVAKLPGAAHKAYFNAVLCLGGLYPINSENHLDKKCLDMGLEARRADTMPTRAVPGINEFIRTLANKYENVTVIDPDAGVTAQRGQSDYLDFFVDFLHPSSLG
ncbi:MAG: hypothetical protein WBS22_03030 [Methylocystis sp.]